MTDMMHFYRKIAEIAKLVDGLWPLGAYQSGLRLTALCAASMASNVRPASLSICARISWRLLLFA
jgi:hypothetical protein